MKKQLLTEEEAAQILGGREEQQKKDPDTKALMAFAAAIDYTGVLEDRPGPGGLCHPMLHLY